MNEKFQPMFQLGKENTEYAKYFIRQSYLNPLVNGQVNISNVTFEPGCRNSWHIHHGSGQILLATDGQGYYQEWGKPVRVLNPGDVVEISPEVKHWHGATKESWFAHISISLPLENASNEWLEEVDEEAYNALEK